MTHLKSINVSYALCSFILSLVSFSLAGCDNGRESELTALQSDEKNISSRKRQHDPSLKYETDKLDCDQEKPLNSNEHPPLASRGYVQKMIGIIPLEDEYNSVYGPDYREFDDKDRAKLAKIYQEYQDISNSANTAINSENTAILSIEFDRSIALVEAWKNSGVKQKNCSTCTGGIRHNVVELPVMIALRKFSLDGNREDFNRRITQYMRVVKPPNNLTYTSNHDRASAKTLKNLEITTSELIKKDIISHVDLHYALSLYFIMNGDLPSAGREWKQRVAGQLLKSDNARLAMADNEDQLILDLANPLLTPFDIVKYPRIDSNKYDVCSGLYNGYIEYLSDIREYYPQGSNYKKTLQFEIKRFSESIDPKLLNESMQRDLDYLSTPDSIP